MLLEDFLLLRASLADRPIGDGGRQVCEELTSSLDTALRALVSEVDWDIEFALVAIGGYGRAELAPFSDVDLMLLHEPGRDPARMASDLFRPLWDSGLRVGHSVRTVEDAASAARARFETHTTLLTSRLITGSQSLFERLVSEVTAVTRARPLRQHLVAAEKDRRQRDPYPVMATDVKNGRGGLRTLQSFEWLQRREELIGRFSAARSPDEVDAYETLLAVRNALHARAGRSYDVFAHELRDPVAVWLGTDVYDVSARLMAAVEAADRHATQRWPELADREDERWKRTRSRIRKRRGVDSGTSPSLADLANIARSGERGRLDLGRLRESGALAEILPEWENVRAAPQLAPFHLHPVDAHLWRTADEMQALITNEERYSAIAHEVADPDALVLAAFLHDIGKGKGGDHSEIGAEIARSVCSRLGAATETVELVAGAVRHHLLLSDTATRRDLDDQTVIDEVVAVIGSLRLLQVLFLLTVADSRATGPTMWSEWKAQLVTTLFARCAARFGADEPKGPPSPSRDLVIERAPPELRGAVMRHLDGLTDEYVRSTSSSDILWHVCLIESLSGWSNLDTRPSAGAQTAVVVGRQREDFRITVAEAFAANGVDVLEARMASRVDGVVVDSYQIRNDRTGGPVDGDRWSQVCADVEASLSGLVDTGVKVAARADAYGSASGASDTRPRVTIEPGKSGYHGTITIRCSNRIGRLAQILALLGRAGVDLRLAKLDSRGGEVVDTFHVRAESLPADGSALQAFERHLEKSLR